MTIPEQAVQAAKDVLYYANPNDVERALTAALPFLPVQGAVKKLEETLRELITDQSEGEWDEKTIEKDVRKFSARILSALEPSAARELALEEAARVCDDKIVSMQANYDQTDNPFIRSNLAGDIALISHLAAAIRALSSPDHADCSKSTSDQKVCQTCNDRGIIGGMHRVGDGDVDAWEEPCPDCQKVKAHHSDADTGSDDLVQIAMHLDCEPDADSILHVIREIQADLDIAKHADAGKVEGDGCKRCGGKGEIVVGKGRHGDTIIEDCPSCTRSQAEAIIAAKNATLQDAIECVKVLTEEKNKLEADNAAKDARVKELEEEVEWAQNAVLARQRHAEARCEALEAKLAAAEAGRDRVRRIFRRNTRLRFEAEKRAEVIEAKCADAEKSAFEHGYVLACCNIVNLHDEPTIAHCTLSELGVTWSAPHFTGQVG